VASWRTLPEVGSVLGIRLLVTFARIFGRRLASGLLYIIAFYYAVFGRTARRASRDYLRRIGQPTTFGMTVRHLQMFAQVALDRLFFLTGKLAPFTFEHHGHEVLVRAAEAKRGVLLLGAHLGSFEVMRALGKAYQLPINVVVDFSNAEKVNGVLRSLAPDMQTNLISLGDDPLTAMLAIRAAIERGELVAILADRTPEVTRGKRERIVMANFLGAPAALPTGPWLLAHTLRCPVYFVAGLYTKPNRYALHLEVLAEHVKLDRDDRAGALARYSQAYASMLETYVRMAPLNWFNFYDFWSGH
jgi:predicted LPLAT superfamily acyltransferase